MKCYSCQEELEDEEDLRLHLKSQRIEEQELGWSDPRARIVLAMTGRDHDLVMVDVSRRALSGCRRA